MNCLRCAHLPALVLAVASFAAVEGHGAFAQPGYEFGIRFQGIQFRPNNFRSFSFPGYAFAPAARQPIPFNNIRFPAFNSRSVRRELQQSRDRRPSDATVAYRGRSDLAAATTGPAAESVRLGARTPFPDRRVRVAQAATEVRTDVRLSRRPADGASPSSVRTAARIPFGTNRFR